MDFDTMREKLAESWEPDYYFKRPEDYRWTGGCLNAPDARSGTDLVFAATAQVQLDWLIIQTNALLYHQKYHEAASPLLCCTFALCCSDWDLPRC
eukprot:551498-Rhodomonas_salina.3